MTHRANRIFPAAVPGMDCNEVCLRDRAMARAFLPLLKMRIPELVDFDLPLSGGARHLAIVAIRKTYPGQARQVATACWGHAARFVLPGCWWWSMRRWMSAMRKKCGRRLPTRHILSAMSGELPRRRDPLDPTSSWRRTQSQNGHRRHAEVCCRGPRITTSQGLLGSRHGKTRHRPLGPVRPGTGGGYHATR